MRQVEVSRYLAELYDPIYSFKDYAVEAARVRELLAAEGIADGSALLDAGCGTGNHLAQLAAWYQVSGFDLGEDMVRIAQRKLPGAHLFTADMAELQVDRSYDALISLFSAIGHVYPEERLRSAARAFARAVRPGGAIVIEPWIAPEDYHPGRLLMHTHDSTDLKLCRAVISKQEGELSVIDFHWLVLRTGAADVEHLIEQHRLWLCPRSTFLAAFAGAGFDARYETGFAATGRSLLVGRRR